jgi:hypothetical protein
MNLNASTQTSGSIAVETLVALLFCSPAFGPSSYWPGREPRGTTPTQLTGLAFGTTGTPPFCGLGSAAIRATSSCMTSHVSGDA